MDYGTPGDVWEQFVPFILSRPSEPFGVWLRNRAREDTQAASIAGRYGADIGAAAGPAEARDALRARLASPADRDMFIKLVRDWLAASIPLDFDDPASYDDRLIAWPILLPQVVEGPAPELATCTVCGDTFAGPFPFLVQDDDDGFVCRDCTGAIPGEGSGLWDAAEGLYKMSRGDS